MIIVCCVVVLFNPQVDIVLENSNQYDFDVVFIDNTENPKYDLNSKRITHVKNNTNIGIAAALNQGIKLAAQRGFNYVITLDQDSIINQVQILSLINCLEKRSDSNQLAVVSPCHSIKGFINQKLENGNNAVSLRTMTSGNLLSIEIWRMLGGFRDDLFIDMVDVEYYAHAIKNGYKILILSDVVIEHNVGDRTYVNLLFFKIPIPNHSYLRKYYQIRNMLYVVSKYKHDVPEISYYTWSMIKIIIGTVFFESDKFRKIKYMYLGVYDYLHGVLGKCKW